VRDEAQRQYGHLLAPARRLVLERFRASGEGDAESPARWERVADWLDKEERLKAWEELAAVLARLQGPGHSPTPVADLRAFLREKSFRLRATVLELEVPARVNAEPPPQAALSVFHNTGPDGEPAWVFRLKGEGRPDARGEVTRYRFERERGGEELAYLPGDRLSAALPLTDGKQFTWNRSGTTFYQFEALTTDPWLHRAGGPPSQGTVARGVRLTVLSPAENGLPRVPDLLPDVKPK
jgi:hypothetical protein